MKIKTRTNTKYYSELIAEKFNLDVKVCHKILMTCSKRIIKIMREGNDLHIENCFDIKVNRAAKVSYYKKVRDSRQAKSNQKDETGN